MSPPPSQRLDPDRVRDDGGLLHRAVWDKEGPRPRTVDALTICAHFLDLMNCSKAFHTLVEEASDSGLSLDILEWENKLESGQTCQFVDLLKNWYDEEDSFPTLHNGQDSDAVTADEAEPSEDMLVDVEAEETSDDDNGPDDLDSAGIKRKRVMTPSSSDASSDSSDDDADDSSDESSSDESAAPPAKKTKIAAVEATDDSDASSSSSSSSDSDSDDSESESESTAEDTTSVDDAADSTSIASSSDATSSSSSDSESDSESDSSSDSEAEATPTQKSTIAKKAKTAPKKAVKKLDTKVAAAATPPSQSSSATLDVSSADEAVSAAEPEINHVHPSRQAQVPDAVVSAMQTTSSGKKAAAIPFSRIPRDQFVDPRFASNEYVSYDYADKAHADLIVTKGKGFTKEKNKKKRGSYRGGMIDMTPKGIKFED